MEIELMLNWRDYIKIAAAREFYGEDGSYSYQKNKCEAFGDSLVRPIFRNTDRALRHIRDPMVVTALTVAAIGSVTLIFYPEECVRLLTEFIPVAAYVRPWMVKQAMFIGTEATILGMGMRAFGRFANAQLMQALQGRAIIPIDIGTVIERRRNE